MLKENIRGYSEKFSIARKYTRALGKVIFPKENLGGCHDESSLFTENIRQGSEKFFLLTKRIRGCCEKVSNLTESVRRCYMTSCLLTENIRGRSEKFFLLTKNIWGSCEKVSNLTENLQGCYGKFSQQKIDECTVITSLSKHKIYEGAVKTSLV